MFAQSIQQLYRQMAQAGYGEQDVMTVLRAYELAAHLFTGKYMSNGEPFLNHPVGVAGVLAAIKRPGHVIAAGLLHSVYAQGDFGDGRRGIWPSRRRLICEAVGEAVERQIVAYQQLKWTPVTIPAIKERLTSSDPPDADAVLMRLANELEHHTSASILYVGPSECRRVVEYGALMVEMAETLGFPSLAAQIAEMHRKSQTAEIPALIRRYAARARPFAMIRVGDLEESITLNPMSSRKAFWVRLQELVFRSRSRLRELLPRLAAWYQRRAAP